MNRRSDSFIAYFNLTVAATTASEGGTALTDHDRTPRLSLVRPKQTDLDVLLQELADIIESEGGILIP